MAFIPAPDTVKVVMTFQSDKLTFAQNVVHVFSSTPGDPGELQNIANIFEDWLFNTAAPGMANDWAAVQVQAIDVSVADGAFAFSDLGHLPFHGTGASGSGAFQACAVVSLRTGLSGRSNRGRLYVCATRGDFIDDNVLTSAGQSAYNTNYNALLDALNTAGNFWMITSYFHNGSPRPAGVSTAVDLIQIPARLGTQRRRLD